MKSTFILFFALLAFTLHADQVSLQWYNDLFAKTDRHLTNGLSLSWLDDAFESKEDNDSNRYSTLAFDITNAMLFTFMDTRRQHNAGISLTQIIITLADISHTEPQYDDVPYIGYLALDFYFFEWDPRSFEEYRIEVGVVGPESGAGWVQKAVHKITDSETPQGWDTDGYASDAERSFPSRGKKLAVSPPIRLADRLV